MEESAHPIENSFFFTRFMVFWITPLIKTARTRQLKESDVWECPKSCNVAHSHEEFRKFWQQERVDSDRENRQPSLLKAIMKCYYNSFLIGGLVQLLFVMFQIGQPFLVGQLVKHVREGNGGIGFGVGLAIALGAISVCSSISISIVFYISRNMGMEVKAALMMAVYEKTLSITSTAKQSHSVGQTTNLAAIDAEKIFLASQFPHFLWQAPLTCLIVMGVLIGEVGVGPALAGMGVLVLLVPIQNHLAGTIGNIRRSMIKHTDQRVMLINEILQAIRIIKLYAWEGPMEKRVQDTRKAELSDLLSYLNVNGGLREVLFVVQPVATLVIYLTSLYAYDKPLQQVQVIKVISFLVITRFPLNLLGVTLKSLKDGSVSLQRLERYLLLPTLSGTKESGGMVADPKIEITNAVMSWGEARETTTESAPAEGSGADKTANGAGYTKISGQADAPSTGDIELQQMRKPENEGDEKSPSSKFSFSVRIRDFHTTSSNELIAVVGSVGSGKSSLISTLLGEMPMRDTLVPIDGIVPPGRVYVHGPLSYCAQTPWIQNMSLKNNVLFGLDADQDPSVQAAYEHALSAACLLPDLRILPDGDETEIGERGINLSGGQKSRVSLARSFMSACRAQIFLLDDPFSAVDGATGNWIFEHGVQRLLSDKIRIVALNSHLHLLKFFHRIVVLDNGEIVADGSPQELVTHHRELISRVTGSSADDLYNPDSPIPTPFMSRSPSKSQIAEASGGAASNTTTSSDVATDVPGAKAEGELSGADTTTETATLRNRVTAKKGNTVALIEKEKATVGAVGYSTYIRYFSASLVPRSFFLNHTFYEDAKQIDFGSWSRYAYGFILLFLMLIMFLLSQAARIGVDLILLRWATNGGAKDSVWGTAYYITIGVLFAALFIRTLTLNYFSTLSSKNIHSAVFRAVISASVPLFYDTHTIGEVLNRFSKDCETMDVNIPEFMLQMLINQLQVVSVFALCVYASPWFALILLPLGVGFYMMFLYFSAVSRDLKKLESVSRSPIYAALSETLTGLETIRAYGDTGRFFQNYLARMERNEKLFYHLWMSMSWVTARLELGSSCVLLAVSLLTVCLRTTVSPIALGLALSYSLQLTALFQRTVQLTIDVTTYMTSTERICEYLNVPQEKNIVPLGDSTDSDTSPSGAVVTTVPKESGDIETGTNTKSTALARYSALATSGNSTNSNLKAWAPKSGKIAFENVWLNYRGNPPVLKGVSFSVRHGERVGVCGRTGAGKSSLMVALFRMVELNQGRITIDCTDVSQVPLQTLRSKLSIIPQDPVLLTGTLRFQLDPFQTYSDTAVWAALDQVNMREAVQSFPGGLSEPVRENGENLSQGQRQLICIARALLRQTQILVVDEGTSAVDPYTDDLVQKVLREQATVRGTTILAIAHRLQTILDFDRILVMGGGNVLEFDTPQNLMQDKNSVFSSMLAEAEH